MNEPSTNAAAAGGNHQQDTASSSSPPPPPPSSSSMSHIVPPSPPAPVAVASAAVASVAVAATDRGARNARGSLRLDSVSLQDSLQAMERGESKLNASSLRQSNSPHRHPIVRLHPPPRPAGNLTNSDSDTIISMSRQISSLAKEVESLKVVFEHCIYHIL